MSRGSRMCNSSFCGSTLKGQITSVPSSRTMQRQMANSKIFKVTAARASGSSPAISTLAENLKLSKSGVRANR